jgi:ubiquinone/menaquinone biosynthesis C-methylase UbiE
MKDNISPQDYWEHRFKNRDPETYDFSESKPAAALAHFCDKYLREGDAVLDVACGGGRNAHYLGQCGYTVYGVDIATSAIEFCKKRFARFNLSGTFKQGAMDNLVFPDDFFAGVICVAAIDHVTIDCARRALVEIRRVLVSNGAILLTFDHPKQDEDIIEQAEVLVDGTFKYIRGEYVGMLFRRYTDKEIELLVGKQNIISFDHIEEGARVIVCR